MRNRYLQRRRDGWASYRKSAPTAGAPASASATRLAAGGYMWMPTLSAPQIHQVPRQSGWRVLRRKTRLGAAGENQRGDCIGPVPIGSLLFLSFAAVPDAVLLRRGRLKKRLHFFEQPRVYGVVGRLPGGDGCVARRDVALPVAVGNLHIVPFEGDAGAAVIRGSGRALGALPEPPSPESRGSRRARSPPPFCAGNA